MERRLDCKKLAPDAVTALLALQKFVDESGLERSLLELVRTRASQINGCALCIDRHPKDARALGESEQRLYGLSAWGKASFYTERERAALSWTEALTRVGEGGAEDEAFSQASTQFCENELVKLGLAVIAINAWNRLMIGFRERPPGPMGCGL